MKLIAKHLKNYNERYKWQKYISIRNFIEVSLVHNGLANNICHLAARVSCTYFEIKYFGSYSIFHHQIFLNTINSDFS